MSVKVSVAMCTYNAEAFIQEQLDSILSQTRSVDEIVICDDGSTDQTHSIISSYQDKHQGLINFKINKVNLGPRKNFEQVTSLAEGDIIFWADQDDVWPANKVSEVLDCFNEHPKVLGVFTNGHLMDQNGMEIGLDLWTSFHFTSKMQEQLNRHSLFQMILQNWTIVTGATLAIKREAKKMILPFQHMGEMWHDEWVGYRLAAEDALIPLHQDLFSYRIHAHQQIGVYNLNEALMRAQRRESFFFHTASGQLGFQSIAFKSERLNLARKIGSYFPQKKNVIHFLEDDLAKEKKRVFAMLPYLKKKILLLKWALEKRNSISFYDLATL